MGGTVPVVLDPSLPDKPLSPVYNQDPTNSHQSTVSHAHFYSACAQAYFSQSAYMYITKMKMKAPPVELDPCPSCAACLAGRSAQPHLPLAQVAPGSLGIDLMRAHGLMR